MGDAADDLFDAEMRWAMSLGDLHANVRTKPKRSNQQIFSQFAGPVHGTFKTGDRVVHVASGVAGTVWATRAVQISWRPDSRVKPGAIWSDENAFRHEGF